MVSVLIKWACGRMDDGSLFLSTPQTSLLLFEKELSKRLSDSQKASEEAALVRNGITVFLLK